MYLSPRLSFHSSLTDDIVFKSDYAHAEKVWKRFFIRTLGEYNNLYLKTDVLLLVDIFKNFRESCIKSYGLDPAYYYTLPGYTSDAMLKHTNITFELLISACLSQCSGRCGHDNNKYMQSYDPSKSSYLMYFEILVNNSYRWAICHLGMCQIVNFLDNRTSDNLTFIASG
ncbi:hypothetical protein ACFW04_011350 [Cataglyphis niger]